MIKVNPVIKTRPREAAHLLIRAMLGSPLQGLYTTYLLILIGPMRTLEAGKGFIARPKILPLSSVT